jgi:hypothetical protein
VVFEPTIPAFERAKTVHGLDCAATVIRVIQVHTRKYLEVEHFILSKCFKGSKNESRNPNESVVLAPRKTNSMTGFFWRRKQLFSYSRNSGYIMEPEALLSCS